MRTLRFLIGTVALFLPRLASAMIVQINTGIHTTIPGVMEGIVNILLEWSGFTATGLFLIGAILMAGSGGNDQYLSAGKRLMEAAIIGFVIVLSAWMVVSTVITFIYA